MTNLSGEIDTVTDTKAGMGAEENVMCRLSRTRLLYSRDESSSLVVEVTVRGNESCHGPAALVAVAAVGQQV